MWTGTSASRTILPPKNPESYASLQDLFWIEAAKYNVLPIDNSRAERFDVSLRPSLTRGRTEFTYYPGMTRIPEGSAPDLKNKSSSILAEVEIPSGGAEGVLMTQGGRFNGLGLYLLAGKPVFHYNLVGVERTTIAGSNTLSPGKHTIVVDLMYDGPGIGKSASATLLVDGQKVGEGRIPRTIPFRVSADETLDIGEDTGTPVSEDYQVPFHFTGRLNKVVIKLGTANLSPHEVEAMKKAEAQIEVIE